MKSCVENNFSERIALGNNCRVRIVWERIHREELILYGSFVERLQDNRYHVKVTLAGMEFAVILDSRSNVTILGKMP
jgi:hypothetical protein